MEAREAQDNYKETLAHALTHNRTHTHLFSPSRGHVSDFQLHRMSPCGTELESIFRLYYALE